MARRTIFNGIQKFNKHTGEVTYHDCGHYRFTGEARFILKENAKTEDYGYLASYVYDCNTEKSEVLILKP
ncbi:MAG: carotenoid oxygenase family protein [Pseudomonadales bacterium]|nr:carotenoid oxygenase family protein [Pseudomonadales bacterium]